MTVFRGIRRCGEDSPLEPKKYPPYLFDVDFDALSLPPEPEEVEAAPPPPTFSEDELQAARDTAFEAGKAEGYTNANSGIEQQLAQTIAALQTSLTTVADAQNAANHKTMRDTVAAAAAIVRKLLPAYARTHGLVEIEEFVGATISTLFSPAEVVIRAPETLAEEIAGRLAPAAAASGFGENLKVVPDPALGPSDCRVEWGNGGAERNGERLLAEIDAIVDRFIEHNEIPPVASALSDAPAPHAAAVEVPSAPEAPAPAAPAIAQPDTIPVATEVTQQPEPQIAESDSGAAFASEQQAAQPVETAAPQELEAGLPAGPQESQAADENQVLEQAIEPDSPFAEPTAADSPAIALPPVEPIVPEEPPEEASGPAALPGAIDMAASEPNS